MSFLHESYPINQYTVFIKKTIMKRFFLKAVPLLILFISTSCSNDELIYSCDAEVDKWAKSNLELLKTMEVSEFLTLETEAQRASFRAFSPEQRLRVWINKMDQVLTLEWNDIEKEHIRLLKSIFIENAIVYSLEATEEDKDAFRVLGYKWVKYATEVLDWDPRLVGAIAGNPNILLNKQGTLKIENNGLTKVKTRSEKTCDCNDDYWIWHDCGVYKSCGWGGNDCDKTFMGCGLSWLDPCVALCQ